MTQPIKAFGNGGFEANLRGAGGNMYQNTNIAITQGLELPPISFDKPGGLYAFGRAAVGNELFYSSSPDFNPHKETKNNIGATLTGGFGLNRTGTGAFADGTAAYRFGTALHSTDLLNTGHSLQGELGIRKLDAAPTDCKRAIYSQHGAYIQSEEYKQNPYANNTNFGYKYEIRQGDKSAFVKLGVQTPDGKTFAPLVGVGGRICFSSP